MTDVLVCARSSAPHRVFGSIDRECAECGVRVMVAPSGLRRLLETPAIRLVCMECAPRLIRDDPDPQVQPITPEQVGEVLGYLRRN